MVDEDDETSKDKEIDKLMSLISLSFKKIYKPTNNNLQTSSNINRANQDNSLRIHRNAGYENQRNGNVVGARENVGSSVKSKRAKDAAYHREKIILCKQEEAGIQLNAEQADWRDNTDDDELEDQELEVHYMYMAQLQEVSPDAADSGPIFDDEPLQKVSNNDYYNVFAMESVRPEQSKPVHDTYHIEQDAQNVIIDSLDMNYDREEIDQNNDDNDLAKERVLLASLIKKLKCEIDENKNRNKFLETSNKALIEKLKGEIEDFKNKNKSLESSNNFFKEANNKLSETNNLLYADYKMSEAELARRNTPVSDEVIRLEKESRSKLSDLIRPFDYDKLYNQHDLFVPQREKSSEQRYFSERSRLSHTNVNNGKSKESFHKQTTLLEKRMDESIQLDKQRQSSLEIFKVKSYVNTIITGVELCKQKIANRTYIGYIDPFIQRVIPTTSVSRPQLKSNPHGDRVLLNSSQGKKQEVEDQHRSVKLPKNKTFVTVCNDSLNAKTLNVNSVSAMCDKCVLIDKHDMCVLNSVAKPIKRTITSESNQKPRNLTRKLYERVSKTCRWWYSKFTPSGYKWKPKSGKENVNPIVSMPPGNASRTANIMDTMTSRRFTVSNTPLSSNSFAARRYCPIHR
nr:hypothetical protein [Tanacetum cinerariifolium]